MTTVGVVLIGRNEGLRLQASIASVLQEAEHSDLHLQVVYVDSGSTDDSVSFARSKGLTVVELDMSIPFTAGRARNEGLAALQSSGQTPDYVQFIDGDCQLEPGWLDAAAEHLEANKNVAVVCGVRREIHPRDSVYNMLCHLEWDAAKGDIDACGGDFMIRAEAMTAAGGFNPTVVAGEEPELCFRLRQSQWKITRLDQSMTHHDAAMTTLDQWFKRSVRSGHAYAQVHDIHGHLPEHIYRRQLVSILFWGLAVPAGTLVLGFWSASMWLIALLAYGYLGFKQVGYAQRTWQIPQQDAIAYAIHIVAGKLPSALGVLKYYRRKLQGHSFEIIEYK
mgnify:CR=1 FL=1